MVTANKISGIADDTKPNAGRIYDYFLGGDHNFEVDRIQGEKLKQIVPMVPKIVRLIRWFLGEAIRKLLAEGYTQFLDFASGLPVQDHIHQIAQEGTKVIYSDIDPITVAYANEIIGHNPNVFYLQCDASNPEKLLNSGIIEKVFDRDKKVAIGMSGIVYFLPEEKVTHSLRILYDWAKKGDKLYLSDNDYTEETEASKKILATFEQMGEPFYWRPKKKMQNLIGKWKVVEPGYVPIEELLKIDKFTYEGEFEVTGGSHYGVIFEK